MVNLYMVSSIFTATNVFMRKKMTVWVYELDCHYGKYVMAVQYFPFAIFDFFDMCWLTCGNFPVAMKFVGLMCSI